MNINLERIEEKLQNLFEQKLISIFLGNKPQTRLIDRLISSMKHNIRQDEGDALNAPDRYLIYLSPEDYKEWVTHQDILNKLAESLYQIGFEEGLIFRMPPSIVLVENHTTPNDHYKIDSQYSKEFLTMEDTVGMPQPDKKESLDDLPKNAYFVINGSKNVILNQPVINIGRHSDNDLTLDDPHISRHHAQLRAFKKQFIIFDVGSTGGIAINGKQLSQATLQAGDVIRMGITTLIYIQDTTSAHPTTAMPADYSDQ
jgi:hypothetical protein